MPSQPEPFGATDGSCDSSTCITLLVFACAPFALATGAELAQGGGGGRGRARRARGLRQAGGGVLGRPALEGAAEARQPRRLEAAAHLALLRVDHQRVAHLVSRRRRVGAGVMARVMALGFGSG